MMKMRESAAGTTCKMCGAKCQKGKKHECKKDECKKDCGDKGTGSKPMK